MIGQHGRDCPKVAHVGDGYLHAANDDRPYDVDGIMYCGRCHGWMGLKVETKAVWSGSQRREISHD